MTDGHRYEDVLALLAKVPRPPEAADIAGATDEQLRALERRVQRELPAALREWLGSCNGVIAGPGVLLGADTATPDLDIAYTQSLWPEWQEAGWLPIATDGSGNAYIMKSAPRDSVDAVYFVDCSEDPGALTYVAASGLRTFLVFLLEKELGVNGWPFDKAYVSDRDPGLADVSDAPAPWDA